MPARAMLEELVRVNAVEELREGEGLRYRPLTRTYIATPLKPDEAQYLGEVLHDLAATIEHNLNPNRTGPKRFERWVGTDKLDKEAIQSFRVIVREQGQRFLETLDNWQTLNEAPDLEGRPGTVRTRVGVFMYEEFLEGESSSMINANRATICSVVVLLGSFVGFDTAQAGNAKSGGAIVRPAGIGGSGTPQAGRLPRGKWCAGHRW